MLGDRSSAAAKGSASRLLKDSYDFFYKDAQLQKVYRLGWEQGPPDRHRPGVGDVASCILDGKLYLAGQTIEEDLKTLEDLAITHILQVGDGT